jgi:hypothetical protein
MQETYGCTAHPNGGGNKAFSSCSRAFPTRASRSPLCHSRLLPCSPAPLPACWLPLRAHALHLSYVSKICLRVEMSAPPPADVGSPLPAGFALTRMARWGSKKKRFHDTNALRPASHKSTRGIMIRKKYEIRLFGSFSKVLLFSCYFESYSKN